jgi:hypothetical protein
VKTFAVGLLSAAALATTILLVRQQRELELKGIRLLPAGDVQPNLSLKRIRELGL